MIAYLNQEIVKIKEEVLNTSEEDNFLCDLTWSCIEQNNEIDEEEAFINELTWSWNSNTWTTMTNTWTTTTNTWTTTTNTWTTTTNTWTTTTNTWTTMTNTWTTTTNTWTICTYKWFNKNIGAPKIFQDTVSLTNSACMLTCQKKWVKSWSTDNKNYCFCWWSNSTDWPWWVSTWMHWWDCTIREYLPWTNFTSNSWARAICWDSNKKIFNEKPTEWLCLVWIPFWESIINTSEWIKWTWKCHHPWSSTAGCEAYNYDLNIPLCWDANWKVISEKPYYDLCKRWTATTVKNWTSWTWNWSCELNNKSVSCATIPKPTLSSYSIKESFYWKVLETTTCWKYWSWWSLNVERYLYVDSFQYERTIKNLRSLPWCSVENCKNKWNIYCWDVETIYSSKDEYGSIKTDKTIFNKTEWSDNDNNWWIITFYWYVKDWDRCDLKWDTLNAGWFWAFSKEFNNNLYSRVFYIWKWSAFTVSCTSGYKFSYNLN